MSLFVKSATIGLLYRSWMMDGEEWNERQEKPEY
jgi:hypothetical protein